MDKPGRKPVGMLPLHKLQSLAGDPHSCVARSTAKIHLGLSPGTLARLKEGLESQLLPQLNRYYPALGAILLGWEQLRCCHTTGLLIADSPAVHVDVSGTFYTFSPRVGSVVPGLVNKKSEKHIGCLVHDTFNISLMGERTDQSVEVGDTIMIEVTKLFWGHRSLPVIQGRHVSDSSRDTPGGKEEEQDYDSGIDSTVNGAAHEHDIDNTLVEEKSIKKNKKRKREDISGDESANPEIKAEVIDNDSISSSKKKKKKRKKESQ